MKIITNNQKRPLLKYDDLSEFEQELVNYHRKMFDVKPATTGTKCFFRYKKELYDLENGFYTFGTGWHKWDYCDLLGDKIQCGIIVKIMEDDVIVGMWHLE